MSRTIRLIGYVVVGILAGLLIASAAIWLLTRTDWGMERARRFAVSWLDERVAGELRLKGMEPTVSVFRQSLIARRVQSFDISAETSVEFEPETFQQMAGLIAYYDTENHYYLRLSHDEKLGRTLNIIATDAAKSNELLADDVPVPETGAIGMRLTLKGAALQFEYAAADSGWTGIGPVLNGAILSDDYNHLGFTGAFVGLCCQDISGRRRHADFAHFRYREVLP